MFQPAPVAIGGRSEIDPEAQPRNILPSTNRQQSAFYQPIEEARKDNALALARYALSVRAQKFVLFAITLIDRHDRNLEKMYTVHAAEFAAWAGLSVQSVRRDFWDPPASQKEVSIGRELLEEVLVLPNYFQPERGKTTALGTHWFSAIMPEAASGPCGYLDVNFNPRLAPLIQMVRERYYTFQRVMIQRFQSSYAIRLYEWLESHDFRRPQLRNRLNISLDNLRGVLGTDRPTERAARKNPGGKSFITIDEIVYERRLALFGHFKHRALDVAVAEMNAHSPWTVEVQTLRARGSRRVGGIVFIVHDKPRAPAATPASKTTLTSGGQRDAASSQMLLPYPPPSHGPEAALPRPPATVAAVNTPPPALTASRPGTAAEPVSDPLEEDEDRPTPKLDDQALLDDMVAKVAAFYKLTTAQVPSVLEYARNNGCQTPQACAAYIHRHSERTRRERPSNPAQHLLAALKGDFNSPVHHNQIKLVADPFAERNRQRAREKRQAEEAAQAVAEAAEAIKLSDEECTAFFQQARRALNPGLFEHKQRKLGIASDPNPTR